MGREENGLAAPELADQLADLADLQRVEAVASEVIVVGEGRLAFAGSLEQLRAGGTVEERFYALMDRKKPEAA